MAVGGVSREDQRPRAGHHEEGAEGLQIFVSRVQVQIAQHEGLASQRMAWQRKRCYQGATSQVSKMETPRGIRTFFGHHNAFDDLVHRKNTKSRSWRGFLVREAQRLVRVFGDACPQAWGGRVSAPDLWLRPFFLSKSP